MGAVGQATYPQSGPDASTCPPAFWEAQADGNVVSASGGPALGGMQGHQLNGPVVDMALSGDGQGYWLLGSDGGVFSFGDARFFGSTGGMHLNRPANGIAASPDGNGYWFVASDGGVFSFGDAGFFGSTGNVHLWKPVDGMLPTADGRGYWLFASDGGIFAFGDARYYGSLGGTSIPAPVVGMAVTSDGRGYWMLDADGNVHPFGDAVQFGPAPSAGPAAAPAVSMVPTSDDGGYWIFYANGKSTGWGDAVPTVTSAAPSASPTRLFAGSLFDQPVSSWSVAPNSPALVGNLVQQYQNHYGTVGVNRMPIFTVPATQTALPLGVQSGCWPSFLTSTGPVPIPPGAYNTNSSDDDLIVEQPSTGQVWELWQATQSSTGQWSACWGGGLNARTSSGVFPSPFGLSATGVSYAATTITEADVASGQINHAIAMQIVDCNGFVAPADRNDCDGVAGTPPEGTWFRMPATTPVPSGMTPFGQMVFRALQRYGAVVVDHAGAVMFEAEDSRDWSFQGHSGVDPITTSWSGNPQYLALKNMPWPALQVVSPPGP